MRPAEWLSRKRASDVPMTDVAPRSAEAALVALCAALREQRGDGPDSVRLKRLIVAYCGHARVEQLAPQDMLIRLKHSLDDALLPVSDDPMARNAMRTRMVKMAIDSYYDDRAASAGP